MNNFPHRLYVTENLDASRKGEPPYEGYDSIELFEDKDIVAVYEIVCIAKVKVTTVKTWDPNE